MELTNGGSLGGYNLALCIFNFIYASMLVLLGGLSFWLDFGRHESEGKKEEEMEIRVNAVVR